MADAPPTEQGDAADLGLVDALAQLSFLVQGKLATYAAAHDVSMAQVRLLGILRDRQPTMAELAGLLGLDKSSVTGLVRRAEDRGLVERRPARDDRRVVRVRLTPSGRGLVGRVSRAFRQDVAEATAALSAADRQRLSRLASAVVARASSPVP